MKKLIVAVVMLVVMFAVPAFAGISDWFVEKTGVGYSSRQMSKYAAEAQQVVDQLQAQKNAEISALAAEREQLFAALVETKAVNRVNSTAAMVFGLIAGLSIGALLWVAYKLGKGFLNLFKRSEKVVYVKAEPPPERAEVHVA